MRTIDKLRETARFLKGNGFESPEKEAEIILRQVLDVDAVTMYRDNPFLRGEDIRAIDDSLYRRLKHEPIQYITGYENFFGLRLLVGPGVLIPRPETELLVEEAIKRFRGSGSRFTVLDLCTGSGCIALALASEFPDAEVYGTDISEIAIRYANKNAELNHVKNVTFLIGDLFEPIERGFKADLIISNPPYIRTCDIEGLQPEIKNWEPVIALDGGEDGLDFYRRIIPGACHYLKGNGLLMMEICPDGRGQVVDMLEKSGFKDIDVIRDYADMERMVIARWRSL